VIEPLLSKMEKAKLSHPTVAATPQRKKQSEKQKQRNHSIPKSNRKTTKGNNKMDSIKLQICHRPIPDTVPQCIKHHHKYASLALLLKAK
jgi:hypothetical protein